MPATIRKLIPLERPRTLEQLIDEAGAINAEISAKEKTYKALREKIALLMPLDPDGESETISTVQEGEEYKAEHAYQVEKLVDPRSLYGFDQELFWQLVKVQTGLAEAVLPPDIFAQIVQVKYKGKPALMITRKLAVK